MESQLNHLSFVFSTPAKEKFYLKLSNCLFAEEKLEYLGHIISFKGLETGETNSMLCLIGQSPLLLNN